MNFLLGGGSIACSHKICVNHSGTVKFGHEIDLYLRQWRTWSGSGRYCPCIRIWSGYFPDDAGADKFDENLPKGDIIVAVGNNSVRQRLCKRVQAAGFNLVNLVHPSAVVSPSARIGAGVVVMPLVVINARACIEEGVIINTAAVVEHDCMIHAYANICPNVSLAGNVVVGESTDVGIGSCAIQGMHIGANSLVGAGSVIVNHVADNVVAYGNPARTQRLLRSSA